MKHYSTFFYLTFLAAMVMIMVSPSCQSSKKETSDKSVQQLSQDAPAEVTTTPPLTLVDFEHVGEQCQDKSANSGGTKVSGRGSDCEDTYEELNNPS